MMLGCRAWPLAADGWNPNHTLRSDKIQNLLGVGFGVHPIYGVGDAAIRANEESAAQQAFVGFSKHLLFSPSTKSARNLVICVCKKGKGELVFVDEVLMLFCAVGAKPQQFVACLAQRSVVVA